MHPNLVEETAHCGFQLSAVIGWDFDSVFQNGLNVFCVKEERDLHGYMGDQKSGLWKTAI